MAKIKRFVVFTGAQYECSLGLGGYRTSFDTLKDAKDFIIENMLQNDPYIYTFEEGDGKNKILLNLAGVGYIDSSGIGELVSSFTAVKKEGGTLKLLKLTQKIQDLLAITKLLTVFDVYDDEGEALSSYN